MEKMTVQQIADVLGYEKDYLRKKVKELYPELVKNGVETKLSQEQVTRLKGQLVPRTLDMKVQGQEAVTDIEMVQKAQEVMQWMQAKLVSAHETIAIMAPKAEFYDAVTGSSDTCDLSTVAKVLNLPGYGRNRIFETLRDLGVLQQNNQPYQKYVDAGYFRVIESSYIKPDGSTHVSYKTVVYQKGVEYIRKLLTKSN